MDYLLPATVYQPPTRPGRGRLLNTIIEDNEDMNHGSASESEGTTSDYTVVGRPITIEIKHHGQSSQNIKQRIYVASTRRPSSVVSSDCDDDDASQHSRRDSYAASDAGTVFSVDSCPSLTGSHDSDATTIATHSSRTSIASRTSRNRYPSLLIPRSSWSSLEGEIKPVGFGMSPSTKIRLSSETLNRLPKTVPAFEPPPSLGDESSIRSESPCVATLSSAPVTPDLHNLEIIEGQSWGGQNQLVLDTPLEIAIDENHSILLSPAEAHSSLRSATDRSTANWSELIGNFPRIPNFPVIPGATPVDTPVTPSIPRLQNFASFTSDHGVQLPEQALQVLHHLDRPLYAESVTDSAASEKEEMKECAVPRSRPWSMNEKSPASEYSFSQLSIPSPGGFFSSLKAGARRTWAPPSRKASPPPPSSTTAENFYNMPWTRSSQLKETVVECGDADDLDGPPTVKQATFDIGIHASEEQDDMYGNGKTPAPTHDYEDAYEEGLKQAAEVNIDRTSDWLAAQTTYLSVLRETNPRNNPADFPATPDSRIDTSGRKDSMESQSREAVEFLQKAQAATSPAMGVDQKSTKSPSPREAVFLEAFTYQRSETKRQDAFLHASARLENVQSMRLALPRRHVQMLLNVHNSKTLDPTQARPKYRGPFSQNPRATGDFSRTAEQAEFYVLERQQSALNAIKLSMWCLEAQRTVLYHGRLLASRIASERLTKRDASFAVACGQPGQSRKRPPRILDLGGAATASWAWSAAARWPNTQVYTVQTKRQADHGKHFRESQEEKMDVRRPATPMNHKVVSVPAFWQLPFGDGHFDVVSARTLHMYLRASPVPGNSSINEWDLTLKECMRVLRPGGILDFFVLDSGVANYSSGATSANAVNLSPSNMTGINALPTAVSDATRLKSREVVAEFKNVLEHHGYEVDGGCGNLASRLTQQGFVGVRQQCLGLPMSRSNNVSAAMRSHQRNMSSSSTAPHYASHFQADGTRKPVPFRFAPRPISEVSTISKLIGQYSDVEAVQGPVGSTVDVADMSALVGELLWEEWLVRLRIESGKYTPETALDGIEETFSEWRRSGKAAWRGLVGCARKPTRKEVENAATTATPESWTSPTEIISAGAHQDFAVANSFLDAVAPTQFPSSAPAGVQRRASVRYSRNQSSYSAGAGLTINTFVARRNPKTRFSSVAHELTTADFTQSAVDRGEVGEIPMMILR